MNDSHNEICWSKTLSTLCRGFKNFLKKSRVHSDITAVKPTHKITCTLAQNSIDR